MTREELVKLADGIETGYTDRNGTPIKVGDEVVYYKKCTCQIDDDEDIKEYPDYLVVGDGYQGYVYSGKVMRYRYKVKFDFEHGLSILDGRKYKYLYEKDSKGNLLTILVDNEKKNPYLTLKQVLGLER